MSSISEILERIEIAEEEYSEIKELIEVNENYDGLPVYKLAENICGKKVRYRLENLVVHLWSAKDYYVNELREKYNKKSASSFEVSLCKNKKAQLIQYLANRIKHGSVTKLKKNMYYDSRPCIATPFILLTNVSAPGEMKPFFQLSGDVLPGFELIGPTIHSQLGSAVGFDTIKVSAEIKSARGRVIADTYTLCAEFSDVLRNEYQQAELSHAT